MKVRLFVEGYVIRSNNMYEEYLLKFVQIDKILFFKMKLNCGCLFNLTTILNWWGCISKVILNHLNIEITLLILYYQNK